MNLLGAKSKETGFNSPASAARVKDADMCAERQNTEGRVRGASEPSYMALALLLFYLSMAALWECAVRVWKWVRK